MFTSKRDPAQQRTYSAANVDMQEALDIFDFLAAGRFKAAAGRYNNRLVFGIVRQAYGDGLDRDQVMLVVHAIRAKHVRLVHSPFDDDAPEFGLECHGVIMTAKQYVAEVTA